MILRRWPAAVGLLGAAIAAVASPDRRTVIIGLAVIVLVLTGLS